MIGVAIALQLTVSRIEGRDSATALNDKTCPRAPSWLAPSHRPRTPGRWRSAKFYATEPTGRIVRPYGSASPAPNPRAHGWNDRWDCRCSRDPRGVRKLGTDRNPDWHVSNLGRRHPVPWTCSKCSRISTGGCHSGNSAYCRRTSPVRNFLPVPSISWDLPCHLILRPW